MFGICLVKDGNEIEHIEGFASAIEAMEEATFQNENPPRRYTEDFELVYVGKWVAYKIR